MDTLATEIAYLGRRLAVELDDFGRSFASSHDLNSNEMRAIIIVIDAARRGQPVSPKQLSNQLNITTASVTALLDRLEAVDHINRHQHPTDRRSITLTPGHHAMQVGQEFFGKLHKTMIDNLSKHSQEDLEAAEKVLATMISSVQAVSESR